MIRSKILKRRHLHCVFQMVIFLLCVKVVFAEPAPVVPEINPAYPQAKLEEITVTGIRFNDPVTPLNTQYGTQLNKVTDEQIKEQNTYDFHSALRDVPGVMYQSRNLLGSQTSHSLYIRGRGASHPSSDFAVEFDGVPRYGALFGQVLSDGTAMSTIGGIEIYKSPQPSQFGSGYALINILPKYMKKEGQEVEFSFTGGSYYTFTESLSGGSKNAQYDAYVSQNWVSTDGHVDHSRAQQQGYYANIGYQINNEWNIRFMANYVSGQTIAPLPGTTPTAVNKVIWPVAERFDTETMLTTLTLNHQYEHSNGYLKAYWNNTNFDLLQELTNGRRYANGSNGLWARQEIALYGIRAREKLNFWPGGQILAGADLDKTELKNTERTYNGQAISGINGGLAERLWNFPNITIFCPYLAVSQVLGRSEGFHVIPSGGVRYYFHDEFEDVWSPQIGLVTGYSNTDLNINYARGVNYPSPVVVMNMAASNSTVSNPSRYWEKIKPEIVDHYEAGLIHTWPKIASLGVTAFYDRGQDRVQAYMAGSIPSSFNDPIGRYEIRGLELTASVTPRPNLEFFTGATWLDAEATGNNNIKSDHLPYTPQFALQAGVKWRFLDNFRLFMDVQHFMNVYDGTSFRRNTLNYDLLDDNSKLDDITLCNARLSYSFDYRPLRLNDSELFLAAGNIFNQHYEYAKGYSMPGATVFAGFSLKFI